MFQRTETKINYRNLQKLHSSLTMYLKYLNDPKRQKINALYIHTPKKQKHIFDLLKEKTKKEVENFLL